MEKLLRTLLVGSVLLAGCTASAKEAQVTRANREGINNNQPIPNIVFSSRRYVLLRYYDQILSHPRLRTCTIVISRGGDRTELAIAETIGMPVNLSNQVTDPTQSEPDSVYPGQSDQTVLVLRNGVAVVSESDTIGVSGDCPTNLTKPQTVLQRVIDYQESRPAGEQGVNFLPQAP